MIGPVWSFRPDGTVFDLLAVNPSDIDFAEMANALSKVNRFNGRNPGPGYSVAQHSVMGADAMFAETRDHALAAAFLLHDGHEYLIGDIVTPAIRAIAVTAGLDYGGTVLEAKARLKERLDRAIFAAIGMVAPHLMARDRADLVHAMDWRMFDAEIIALLGEAARTRRLAPHLPAPKLTGAIRPWGPAKAETAFLDRLKRYAGLDVRLMAVA